ncbi:MAG TPA: ATP-dependent zinc metalloprotease FtsH [Acidimicrobiia bacterium]|nr:ATP-dependent zinc metalloprotease FtsH [Acidimicrobiia bacterium]
MTKLRRSAVLIVVVAAVVAFFVVRSLTSGSGAKELSLDGYQQRLSDGQVSTATIHDQDHTVTGDLKDGTHYKVDFPDRYTNTITQDIVDAGVKKVHTDHQNQSPWLSLLFSLLPFVLLALVLLWVLGQVQGGGSRVMGFGKSRAKLVSKDQPKVTFADVAGLDEAVEELEEIKEFLAAPAKFQEMGAKIPKGVLLFGPPGTGKTLLAKAVAGEAGVPFFSISGSDFVEMFVGVGASRVRDLFEQAKGAAPAIVFVDEIDAVGRHRGAGLGGGHDEREQTLNQLLVEMDGFDQKQGVILLASTNRPDILDPALLRPGRFDRQIVVDRPDLEGRKAILAVHGRGKPLAPGVDLDVIARRTPGFTGADLANLMNEAALLSARHDLKLIGLPQLEEAIDRVMAGPERRSRLISDREKRVIAYHEGGHALVAHALPNTDPVHKISIIPRGRALGYTLTLPTEDKFLVTRSELVDELSMLLGGRTAEELIFADPTTGAQNDIDRATTIARQMVTEYGMSDSLGPMRFGHPQGEVFLGRDFTSTPDYSDEVAASIDNEVRALIDSAHAVALDVLTDNRGILDRLAAELIEHETLETERVQAIFADVRLYDAGTSDRASRAQRPEGSPPAPGRPSAAAATQTDTQHRGGAT